MKRKFISWALVLSLLISSVYVSLPAFAKMSGTDPEFFKDISVNGDRNDTDAKNKGSILNDGYYYSTREIYMMKDSYKANSAGDLFVSFTEPNEYFQVNFSSGNKKMITRMDIWVRGLDSIDEFMVERKHHDNTWKLCSVGGTTTPSLKKGFTAEEIENAEDKAYCYTVLFDKPLEHVVALRFTILSYGAKGKAEISEVSIASEVDGVSPALSTLGSKVAGLRSTSFTEKNLLKSTIGSNSKGAFEKTGDIQINWSDQNEKANPFLNIYYASADTEGVMGWYNKSGLMWPASTYNTNANAKTYVKANASGQFFYIIDTDVVGQAVNYAKLAVQAGKVNEFEVLASNNVDTSKLGKNGIDLSEWTILGKMTADIEAGKNATLYLPNKDDYRYWLVRITKYAEGTSLASVDLGEVTQNWIKGTNGDVCAYAGHNAINGAVIETAEGPWAYELNLPKTVDGYDVIWDSDSPYINSDSGEISYQPTEQVAVLSAKVPDKENPAISKTFYKTIILAKNDTRAKVTLIDNDFDLDNWDNFSYSDGDAEISTGSLKTGNGTAIIKSEPPYGFEYSDTAFYRIKPAAHAQYGEINFKDGDTKLFGLDFNGTSLSVDCAKGAKTVSLEGYPEILVETDGKYFNIYTNSGEGDIARVYKAEMLENGSADRVEITAAGGDMDIDKFSYTVLSKELFEAVKEQFDFAKISGEDAANVTENLKLIDTIGNISFSYASSDDRLIDSAGVTAPSDGSYVCYTVTANSPEGEFSRSFDLMVGGDNKFTAAAFTSSVTSATGHRAEVIGDGATVDGYGASGVGEFSIDIDLKAVKIFNRLVILPLASDNPIKSYTISTSEDNVNFEQSFTASGIVNGANIDVGIQKGRYIRITAKQNAAATNGYREILAYLDVSSDAQCEYDLKEFTDAIDFEAGGTAKKTGTFGSVITAASSNPSVISITTSGDSYNVKVTKPASETQVTITITADLGGGVKKTATETIVLLGSGTSGTAPTVPADTNVPGNSSSSGSGSSGGGASVIAPSYPVVPDAGTQNPPATGKVDAELDGHWAKAEIQSLIDKKIVEGTGTSLELDKDVTRAEFLKMIIAGFGYELKKYDGCFTDVSSDLWFADYVQTAKDMGIMSGDGESFRGNDPISRQEMCVALSNMFKNQGVSLDKDTSIGFADFAAISDWATDSVIFMADAKIINGYPTGEFMPHKSLRRDEAMTVIFRALEMNIN